MEIKKSQLLLFISLLIGIVINVHAQSSQNRFLNQNIFPSKPDVADIGKYGDVPISLATGQLNLSIPLYEINIDGFKMPIGLSYNYTGFRVEEVPGRVGLGWTFLAGGSISRQIHGLPDDGTGGYISNNGAIPKNHILPYYNNVPLSIGFLEAVMDGYSDTEPDKFIINAGNLHASFYLNEDRQPVFAPHSNVKVECDWQLNAFLITDDNGIKYKFDLHEMAESEHNGMPSTPYKSSWLLSEISLPNTESKIHFEYSAYPFSQYSISQSASKSWSEPDPDCTACRNKYRGDVDQVITNTVIDGGHLNKIIFPEGSIEIATLPYPDDATVQSIKQIDKNNSTISEYAFEYDNYGFENSGKLLKKIDKKSNNIPLPYYNFLYYPINAANAKGYRDEIYANTSLDFAQDFWGYYNGKNNSGLLPDFISESKSSSITHTLMGALKRITYPTGGYTDIEYELNTVGNNYLNEFKYFSPSEFNQSQTVNLNHHTGSTVDETQDAVINILEDQVVEVNYNLFTNSLSSTAEVGISRISTDNPYCEYGDGQNYVVEVSSPIYCLTFGKILEGEMAQNDPNNTNNVLSEGRSWNVRVKKGQYKLSSRVFNSGKALVKVSWNDFSSPATYPEQYAVGGIRVSKTISFNSSNSTTPLTKKYKYTNEDLSKSSGILTEFPIYDVIQIGKAIECTPDNPSPATFPVEQICQVYSKFAQSRIPLATFRGSHILYKRVEVLEGSDGENGKTVYKYTGEESGLMYFPFPAIDRKEWRNGLELKRTIFDNSSNLKQTTQSTYNPLPPNIPEVKALKIGLRVIGSIYYTESNYVAVPYDYQSDFVAPLNITATQYEGTSPSLTSSTDYTYYSDTKYPWTVTTTNSKGETTKSETKYPTQHIGTPVYDAMIARNQINVPIEKLETKEPQNIQLSKVVNNYGFFPDNTKILPTTVQASVKGNPLETEVTYNTYDSRGNPLEYTTKDGLKVCIIWGYNKLHPVAKIVNADYVTVSVLVNQTLLNNPASTEAQIKTELNNLRIALANTKALITTYTYKPLIGISTETDPNGNTIYYEYDSFNRLKLIKDKDGNIVKKYDYKYFGQ